LCFPEFSPTRYFELPITALVSPETGGYDVILGNDVLRPAKFVINSADAIIQWLDLSIPWQDLETLTNETFSLETANSSLSYDAESYSTSRGVQEILEAKYDKVSTTEVANQQTHLSQRQREQLAGTLAHFTELFSGKLGCYPHTKVHLELTPDAKPFHTRPYSVPHAHMQVFRDELERLVDLMTR
jgi:hypothetical protein